MTEAQLIKIVREHELYTDREIESKAKMRKCTTN